MSGSATYVLNYRFRAWIASTQEKKRIVFLVFLCEEKAVVTTAVVEACNPLAPKQQLHAQQAAVATTGKKRQQSQMLCAASVANELSRLFLFCALECLIHGFQILHCLTGINLESKMLHIIV